MPFVEILDGGSAARNSSGKRLNRHRDGGFEGNDGVAKNVLEKRCLLDIDLNVAPPEDDVSKSPIAEKGVLEVADDFGVSEGNTSSGGENDSDCSGVGEAVGEAYCGENRGVESRSSNGEVDGFGAVTDGGKEKWKKSLNISSDSDAGRKEKESRNRHWNALLEVAANSLLEYAESLGNRAHKKLKREPDRTLDIGGTNGETNAGDHRHSFAESAATNRRRRRRLDRQEGEPWRSRTSTGTQFSPRRRNSAGTAEAAANPLPRRLHENPGDCCPS